MSGHLDSLKIATTSIIELRIDYYNNYVTIEEDLRVKLGCNSIGSNRINYIRLLYSWVRGSCCRWQLTNLLRPLFSQLTKKNVLATFL